MEVVRTHVTDHTEETVPASRAWRWAPVPLRLMLGFGFMYHGFPKLFSAAGHQQFAATLAGLGVPASSAVAIALAVIEFFGGLAIFAGFLVRPAAALLILDMLGAMLLIHWPNGFSFIHITGMGPTGPTFGMPGIEVNLLYIAGLLSLFLANPGPASLGREVRRRRVVTRRVLR